MTAPFGKNNEASNTPISAEEIQNLLVNKEKLPSKEVLAGYSADDWEVLLNNINVINVPDQKNFDKEMIRVLKSFESFLSTEVKQNIEANEQNKEWYSQQVAFVKKYQELILKITDEKGKNSLIRKLRKLEETLNIIEETQKEVDQKVIKNKISLKSLLSSIKNFFVSKSDVNGIPAIKINAVNLGEEINLSDEEELGQTKKSVVQKEVVNKTNDLPVDNEQPIAIDLAKLNEVTGDHDPLSEELTINTAALEADTVKDKSTSPKNIPSVKINGANIREGFNTTNTKEDDSVVTGETAYAGYKAIKKSEVETAASTQVEQPIAIDLAKLNEVTGDHDPLSEELTINTAALETIDETSPTNNKEKEEVLSPSTTSEDVDDFNFVAEKSDGATKDLSADFMASVLNEVISDDEKEKLKNKSEDNDLINPDWHKTIDQDANKKEGELLKYGQQIVAIKNEFSSYYSSIVELNKQKNSKGKKDKINEYSGTFSANNFFQDLDVRKLKNINTPEAIELIEEINKLKTVKELIKKAFAELKKSGSVSEATMNKLVEISGLLQVLETPTNDTNENETVIANPDNTTPETPLVVASNNSAVEAPKNTSKIEQVFLNSFKIGSINELFANPGDYEKYSHLDEKEQSAILETFAKEIRHAAKAEGLQKWQEEKKAKLAGSGFFTKIAKNVGYSFTEEKRRFEIEREYIKNLDVKSIGENISTLVSTLEVFKNQDNDELSKILSTEYINFLNQSTTGIFDKNALGTINSLTSDSEKTIYKAFTDRIIKTFSGKGVSVSAGALLAAGLGVSAMPFFLATAGVAGGITGAINMAKRRREEAFSRRGQTDEYKEGDGLKSIITNATMVSYKTIDSLLQDKQQVDLVETVLRSNLIVWSSNNALAEKNQLIQKIVKLKFENLSDDAKEMSEEEEKLASENNIYFKKAIVWLNRVGLKGDKKLATGVAIGASAGMLIGGASRYITNEISSSLHHQTPKIEVEAPKAPQEAVALVANAKATIENSYGGKDFHFAVRENGQLVITRNGLEGTYDIKDNGIVYHEAGQPDQFLPKGKDINDPKSWFEVDKKGEPIKVEAEVKPKVEVPVEPKEPKGTVVEPKEPKGTVVEPKEPKGTVVEPKEPKGTVVEPKEPKGTVVEPKEPKGTVVEPKEPKGTVVEPKEPKGTVVEPKEPKGTVVEPKEPKGTVVEPKEPKGTVVEPKEPKGTVVEPKDNTTAFGTEKSEVNEILQPEKVVPQNNQINTAAIEQAFNKTGTDIKDPFEIKMKGDVIESITRKNATGIYEVSSDQQTIIFKGFDGHQESFDLTSGKDPYDGTNWTSVMPGQKTTTAEDIVFGNTTNSTKQDIFNPDIVRSTEEVRSVFASQNFKNLGLDIKGATTTANIVHENFGNNASLSMADGHLQVNVKDNALLNESVKELIAKSHVRSSDNVVAEIILYKNLQSSGLADTKLGNQLLSDINFFSNKAGLSNQQIQELLSSRTSTSSALDNLKQIYEVSGNKQVPVIETPVNQPAANEIVTSSGDKFTIHEEIIKGGKITDYSTKDYGVSFKEENGQFAINIHDNNPFPINSTSYKGIVFNQDDLKLAHSKSFFSKNDSDPNLIKLSDEQKSIWLSKFPNTKQELLLLNRAYSDLVIKGKQSNLIEPFKQNFNSIIEQVKVIYGNDVNIKFDEKVGLTNL